jgi:hypothetical protein
MLILLLVAQAGDRTRKALFARPSSAPRSIGIAECRREHPEKFISEIKLQAKKQGAAGITTAAPYVADQLGQGG